MTKKRRGDIHLIQALARGETVSQAASIAGISERTVYRRLADPEYRQQISVARGILLDHLTGQVTDAAQAAIETLMQLLGADSESVRLGAARAILDNLFKFREMGELESRVQIIEDWITNRDPM